MWIFRLHGQSSNDTCVCFVVESRIVQEHELDKLDTTGHQLHEMSDGRFRVAKIEARQMWTLNAR